MPTTAQNVSLIQYRRPKYGRPEILAVLDEIQAIVYSVNTRQTEYIDPATGLPPFLATQNDRYAYNGPANCRQTLRVFSDNPVNTYSRTRPSPVSGRYYYHGKGYYRISVDSRDATPGVLATVIFKENPGDTTDTFYHLYYLQPVELTTEQVQLTLPVHVHYLMREGVFALLGAEEYGTSGLDMSIMDKVTRAIRNQLNRGAQSGSGRTPWQEEFHHFPDETKGYHH